MSRPGVSASFLILAAAAFVLVATVGQAAPTPEQACQAAKSKAAGKYALCRQAAEGKLATTGDVPKYTSLLATCGTRFTTAWQKAIDKAASVGATCPDDALSASDYQTIITAHSLKVASGLAGMGLEVCSVATRLRTGQTTCYDGGGAGIPCASTGQDGQLQKGIARSYTDNGDGTVTDDITGLMWEKLADDGSIHDKDTLYTWTDSFTAKIGALNTANFAGHNDWRLPNVNEVQSLTNFAASPIRIDPPFDSGCIASCDGITCSCTRPGSYWSSTTYEPATAGAWGSFFDRGDLQFGSKAVGAFLRAVRGGS